MLSIRHHNEEFSLQLINFNRLRPEQMAAIFICILLSRKCFYIDSNFPEMCSQCVLSSIDSWNFDFISSAQIDNLLILIRVINQNTSTCNSLMINRWVAIIWINDGQIYGLVQGYSISSVLAMEILQSCTKPSNASWLNALWETN